MLQFPAERTQIDGLQPTYSAITAIDFTNDRGRTRQEAKDETDVNVILRRFGVMGHNRPPIYTDTDYEMDLHTALNAVDSARAAYARAPEELKEKYPTFEDFAHAVNTNQYEEPVKKTEQQIAEEKAKADEGGVT